MIGNLLGWLRNRQEAGPVPEALWQIMLRRCRFSPRSATTSRRLRSLAEDFLAEKEFTAAGGLELSDAICVSIAAQGCLPILNLGLDYYRGWVGVIVYADEFIIPRSVEDEFGVVHEYQELASGEAWDGGPLLISWRDAQMAAPATTWSSTSSRTSSTCSMATRTASRRCRRNFARRLAAGATRQLRRFLRWSTRLRTAARKPRSTPMPAENPGEFFAVMSEAFFETPDLLQAEYPALYENLAGFYRQDPVASLPRSPSALQTT
jgi:Mlc titration factor MtfA (ptsG expression regulator)